MLLPVCSSVLISELSDSLEAGGKLAMGVTWWGGRGWLWSVGGALKGVTWNRPTVKFFCFPERHRRKQLYTQRLKQPLPLKASPDGDTSSPGVNAPQPGAAAPVLGALLRGTPAPPVSLPSDPGDSGGGSGEVT